MKFAQRLVLAALQEMAARGLTARQASDQTGMSYAAVSYYRDNHNVPFAKVTVGRPINSGVQGPDERSERMRELYQSGKTLVEIGAEYKITRERVRQIIHKHYKLRAVDGGKSEQTRQARREFQRKRDKRSQRSWGCDYRTYRKILKQEGKPTYCYWQQRRNAKTRGIKWELNLWQWWQIWQHSGHWADRGRGTGYGMCRHNDAGPYAVDNVYIATGIENIQDYWATDPEEKRAKHREFTRKYYDDKKRNQQEAA